MTLLSTYMQSLKNSFEGSMKLGPVKSGQGDYLRCTRFSFLPTHVTDLWVARLRLWDQLRWAVTVNSTLLSDNLGLKHFDFEFVILCSPRQ